MPTGRENRQAWLLAPQALIPRARTAVLGGGCQGRPLVRVRAAIFTHPRAPATRAAQLNRIECHLSAIGEFVVNNADYADWNTFKKAMA